MRSTLQLRSVTPAMTRLLSPARTSPVPHRMFVCPKLYTSEVRLPLTANRKVASHPSATTWTPRRSKTSARPAAASALGSTCPPVVTSRHMVSIAVGPPRPGVRTADGRIGSGSVVHGPTVVVVDATVVEIGTAVVVVSTSGSVRDREVDEGYGSIEPWDPPAQAVVRSRKAAATAMRRTTTSIDQPWSKIDPARACRRARRVEGLRARGHRNLPRGVHPHRGVVIQDDYSTGMDPDYQGLGVGAPVSAARLMVLGAKETRSSWRRPTRSLNPGWSRHAAMAA